MPFYEMVIIDTCENYRNFSHVPIQEFSVVENLVKHCDLYNKNSITNIFLQNYCSKMLTTWIHFFLVNSLLNNNYCDLQHTCHSVSHNIDNEGISCFFFKKNL